jgi:hypothetical protein
VAPGLVARKWTYGGTRASRVGLQARIRALVVRMAPDNPTWSYTRIQGALQNVGHHVGRSTIARVLKAAGIPPSRQRPLAWRTFLQAHWPALVAADFFTTEVWTARGLVMYCTAFVIELHTRRVCVLGSTPNPDGAFVVQAVRGLLGETDAIRRESRVGGVLSYYYRARIGWYGRCWDTTGPFRLTPSPYATMPTHATAKNPSAIDVRAVDPVRGDYRSPTQGRWRESGVLGPTTSVKQRPLSRGPRCTAPPASRSAAHDDGIGA